MARYDQCDSTCTVDCGHCKGAGRPRNAFERLYAHMDENAAFKKLVAIMVDHARDVASYHEDSAGIEVSLKEVVVRHVRDEFTRTQ